MGLWTIPFTCVWAIAWHILLSAFIIGARIRLMGSPEERTSSASWTVLPHEPARTRLSKIVVHFDKPSKRGFIENDHSETTDNEN